MRLLFRYFFLLALVRDTMINRGGPGMFPGKKPDPEPPKEDGPPGSPAEPRLDKTEQWRFDKLVAAGYTETQALWLAIDRSVDLHRAVALRSSTELAFSILS